MGEPLKEEPEEEPKPEPTYRERLEHDLRKAMREGGIESVLGHAVGAGSACWENLADAGVFKSDQARDIVEVTAHVLRSSPRTGPAWADTSGYGWNGLPVPPSSEAPTDG